MQNLDEIAERIRHGFDARTAARDQALAQENLQQAQKLAEALCANLSAYPDIYFAGYTQDALKEFAEASITYALVGDQPLPSPEELNLEHATYLQGLAEAAGELRRRCLDILRHGHSLEAERLLTCMDDIYGVLVTMDYPDAITGGLRRLTDILRAINERTRGDVTVSMRQEKLEQSLLRVENKLRED
jgi:translin